MFSYLRTLLYSFLCIISLSILHISAEIKNIIFDLNGVVFETKKLPVVQQLGLAKLVCYGISTFQNPRNIEKRLFEVLEKIEPYTTEQERNNRNAPRDTKGNILPPLMRAWLNGSQNGTAIISKVMDACKNQDDFFISHTEKVLVARLARSLFIPTNYINCQSLHSDATKTVRKLKQQGYKLYILSNWDEHSFELVRTNHKEFLALFDGVVISGEAKMAKPDTAIYNHLLTTYNLQPHESIFIDDQQINIDAARQLGIHAILCPQHGYVSKSPNLALAYEKIMAHINACKENDMLVADVNHYIENNPKVVKEIEQEQVRLEALYT